MKKAPTEAGASLGDGRGPEENPALTIADREEIAAMGSGKHGIFQHSEPGHS